MQHLFWGLLVGFMLLLGQPAQADTTLETVQYRCDDSPLAATLHTGAVDLPTAPNTVDGLPPCLLYTSPSPRDKRQSRMPSSA